MFLEFGIEVELRFAEGLQNLDFHADWKMNVAVSEHAKW